MAQGNQRIHGAAAGLPVVDADAGKVGEGEGGGVVGQQQAGDLNFFKIREKIAVISPHEQDAQGLFLPAQLHRPEDLVGVLIQIVHMYRIAGVAQLGLDGFHQLGKKLVGGALHHDQDGGGMLLL